MARRFAGIDADFHYYEALPSERRYDGRGGPPVWAALAPVSGKYVAVYPDGSLEVMAADRIKNNYRRLETGE